MWDHLGQIVGGAPVGIGTRGPGEQQIEIDRRIANARITRLRRELDDIRGRRVREVEQRNLDHFTVGLVGYTNAGKSTLFNRVTAGGAFAHSKLFATLSTRIERWNLGSGDDVLLSDTVGFIRDLPHHLVASFRSTLEETIAAQVLVILVDGADPNAEMQLETVLATLNEIGATTQPRIIVINKIDQLEHDADLLVWLNRHPDAIPISAVSGAGLEELASQVLAHKHGAIRTVRIGVSLRDGRTVAVLEQRTTVLERHYDADRVEIECRIGRRQIDELLAGGASLTIDGRPPVDAVREIWGEPDDDQPDPGPPPVPPHERFRSEADGSS